MTNRIPPTSLGRRLRHAREDAELTIAEIAALVGVSAASV